MDETTLAGTWDVEIWRGWLPWNRTTVRGQIQLASASLPECTPDAEGAQDGFLCRTHAQGTYSVPLKSLVRPHPYAGWTPEASAIAMADGAILVQMGGCCDRGEISAKGRLDGDRIEGSWVQQFLDDGPGGRFVMHRAP